MMDDLSWVIDQLSQASCRPPVHPIVLVN